MKHRKLISLLLALLLTLTTVTTAFAGEDCTVVEVVKNNGTVEYKRVCGNANGVTDSGTVVAAGDKADTKIVQSDLNAGTITVSDIPANLTTNVPIVTNSNQLNTNAASQTQSGLSHVVGETITCQASGDWYHIVNGNGGPNALTFTLTQEWLDYLNNAAATGAINGQAAENQLCKSYADQSGDTPPTPPSTYPVVTLSIQDLMVNQLGKAVCDALEASGYDASSSTPTMSQEEFTAWAEGAFGWKKHGRARTWPTNVCWENGSGWTQFSADVSNAHINDGDLSNDGNSWQNKLINHWYQVYLNRDLVFVTVIVEP